MSRGLIIAVAALCGAGAFLWTLLAPAPRQDGQRSPARPGAPLRGPRFPGAMRIAPGQSLDALEDQARTPGSDFLVWFDLAQRRLASGKAAAAQDAWKKVVELARETLAVEPQRARAWFALGWASDKLGDRETARDAYSHAEPLYAAALATPPADVTIFSRLGWIRRGLGDEPGARDAWHVGESILTRAGRLDADSAYNLACFRALLADPDPALDALGLAVDRGFCDADWAAADDDLAPIAREPRFGALLAKMRQTAPARQDGASPAVR